VIYAYLMGGEVV